MINQHKIYSCCRWHCIQQCTVLTTLRFVMSWYCSFKGNEAEDLHSTLLTNVGWLSQSSQVQSRLSNSALCRYRRLMLAMLHNTTQESRILRQSVEFEELFRAILAMPIDSCQKQNRIKKKQQTQIIHYRYPEIKYSNIKLQRREKRNSSPRLAISICSFCLCYFFERIFC